MKALPVVAVLAATLSFSLSAQAPDAVDMAKESHHRVMVENSYVRALRFSLPAGESTLLHLHNSPYVAITTGPAEFTNAVSGKPDAHAKLADGQVSYSRGGFSHVVRADAGSPFSNVTVELLRAQGDPHNLCDKIVPGDVGACDLSRNAPDASLGVRPMFETDEILVEALTVRGMGGALDKLSVDKYRSQPALLVAVNGAPLQVTYAPGGSAGQVLHAGEMTWLHKPDPTISAQGGPESHLVLIVFKDGPDVASTARSPN